VPSAICSLINCKSGGHIPRTVENESVYASRMGVKMCFETSKNKNLYLNIGTQSVQEFFCDRSIRRTVYSNDLLSFFACDVQQKKKCTYDVTSEMVIGLHSTSKPQNVSLSNIQKSDMSPD